MQRIRLFANLETFCKLLCTCTANTTRSYEGWRLSRTPLVNFCLIVNQLVSHDIGILSEQNRDDPIGIGLNALVCMDRRESCIEKLIGIYRIALIALPDLVVRNLLKIIPYSDISDYWYKFQRDIKTKDIWSTNGTLEKSSLPAIKIISIVFKF